MPQRTRRRRPPHRLVAAVLAAVLSGCAVEPASPPPSPVAPSIEPVASVPAGSTGASTPASPPPATPLPGTVGPPAPPASPPVLGSNYLRGEPPRAALQARLLHLAERYDLPGVSVTILWPGGDEWTGTAGVADVTGDRAITVGTGFALGSISKTYTAANTLKLVEEGVLRLDDRAARYLPALKLDQRITIRMLLEHTSGLPDFFLNAAIDGPLQARPNAAWTTARALRYVRKPLFPPGTRWSYSNTNYLLLGMIDEVADGRPLAVQLRARFLDPLHLDETWSQAAEQPRAATTRGHRVIGTGPKRRAVPVFDGDPVMPFRSVVTAAGGAGGIAATSRDAARWMEALVLRDVLLPGTRDEMVGAAIYTTALGARIPYGMGLQVVELRHRPAIGHSGRLLGFRAVVRVLPVERMTIAVLTNQSTIDPSLIASSLLQLALPRVPGCGVCPTIL